MDRPRRRDDWDEADERGDAPPPPRFVPLPGTAGARRPAVSLPPEREQAVRDQLIGRSGRLAADLETLERRIAPGDDGPRPQYGKRAGDHTSEALDSRRNATAADAIRAQLAECARALAKLAEGSYGLCDGCGREIGAERLEALPWATQCVECRAARQRSRAR